VSGQELYDLLPERPADVLANWREIRLKIHDEFDLAKTEEQRVALLAAFTAMMNLVEPNIAPEEREKFQMARRQDYKLLIAKECLVGEKRLHRDSLRRYASRGARRSDVSRRITIYQHDLSHGGPTSQSRSTHRNAEKER
jgi:hypothetical protein